MSTTGDRLRNFWGERQTGGGQAADFARKYWQIGALLALMALAAGLRLWALGERAIHHDESIHIKFAWDITQNGVMQYVHDPTYHGPFQYFGTAATFIFFGDSDYTSRLFPALFGILLVGLPFFLRRQLGTVGMLAAAGLLAVSPALIYFSRFARNDIYVAFFTLAIVICIWRYLEDRRNGWLIAIAPLLAFSFAAKEVTYIVVAIFLIYLNVMIAMDLVQQLKASRKMTPGNTALAYAVTVPLAWLIVALWPLADLLTRLRANQASQFDRVAAYAFIPTSLLTVALAAQILPGREALLVVLAALAVGLLLFAMTGILLSVRDSLSLSTMPAAGPLLIIIGTLVAVQFAAGVQKLPFVADSGYMGEPEAMGVTVILLFFATMYVGLVWNWRVWSLAALLFYIPFFVLFTSFFRNGGDIWNVYTLFTPAGGGFLQATGEFWQGEGGFWTGLWGSMDYWLGQQLVRRGDQPDYYYFMLLPVYEFLPLVFAIGGALYYAFRGALEQRLMAGAALLLVLVFSVIPDSTWLIGGARIQLAFLTAICAVLLLSMNAFTKFLLFWTLSTLFALTVAGEKMPWLTIHVAMPLALLAAKILNDLFASARSTATEVDRDIEAADEDEEEVEEPDRRRGMEPSGGGPNPLLNLLPILVGAVTAGGAAFLFAQYGPASVISIVAWLLSLVALASVLWAARDVSWENAGQVAAAALFAALLIFTVRAGANAAFDQGSPDGYAEEIFIYAQGSPKLSLIRNEIDRRARLSGLGNELPINIDNTVNIWPWPWYLRDYSVRYDDFSTATPDEGAVIMLAIANRDKIEPFQDDYEDGIPYTHMWWFPEFYKNLDMSDFLSDALGGGYNNTWRDFFIDRFVAQASSTADMIAFFPKDPSIPDPPDIPTPEDGTADLIPDDAITVIGGPGSGEGEFKEPAGITVDADGNLYVVDRLNQRVQKFDADGQFVTMVGEQGNEVGQFHNPNTADPAFAADGPWGVGTDAAGNVYVADTWNHRVQVFSSDLEFTRVLGEDLFGPRDITFDADGDLLLVDTGNHRVREYAADGGLKTSFGSNGGDEGQFNEPSSITVSASGDIYVADFWNQRIQHFDSDFQYVDEISVPSWGSQGITDRAYIVVLPDGTVIATDPGNGRFLVFDPSGEEVAAWSFSTGLGTSRPTGIAVDGLGRLYVSDGVASRVIRVPLTVVVPSLSNAAQ
ncbi:MAG: TIGR03663 family protein [Chloroflexi bacterium]|nr:TIGR03663 family protein [Chloroflexota bacterium]